MFKEFPQLKNKLGGDHLWNPSSFVATVSEHTKGQIRKYIQDQKVK
ncbi:transposase [Paenibacillus terreus]|uniref:Transposase n=1 Tax=Paenibacillus terreus TaxID=1387834 RepID=A0ABV5BCV6_9BACL